MDKKDEALTEGTYNEIVSQLMKVTDASADACAVAKKNSGWNGSKVRRDEASACRDIKVRSSHWNTMRMELYASETDMVSIWILRVELRSPEER